MSPRIRRFALHYSQGASAAAAARLAGYSSNTLNGPATTGFRLLQRSDVRNLLNRIDAQRRDALQRDAERRAGKVHPRVIAALCDFFQVDHIDPRGVARIRLRRLEELPPSARVRFIKQDATSITALIDAEVIAEFGRLAKSPSFLHEDDENKAA